MDGAGGGNPGSGGGFDPCECFSMLRLTNMLRNAQTTCTDTECFPGRLPGLPANDGNTGMTNMYLMLALWLTIAFLLFIFRPRTLRNNREQPGKSNNQGPRRDNQDPPGPEVQSGA